MAHPPHPSGAGGRLRIFVFDRNVASLLGMERLLAYEGWDVVVASSADAGLVLLRGEPADVLVLDVCSHQPADVVAVAEIRRLHPKAPILLTTTDEAGESDAIFIKPIDIVAFLTRLRRLGDEIQRTRGSGNR